MNDSSPTRGHSGSDDAQNLREAVTDAYAALQTAHLNYEQAAAIGRDIDEPLNLDGVAARKAGLDYAAAVHRYSNAVMAWVGYVDSHFPAAKKKSRGKTAAGQ